MSNSYPIVLSRPFSILIFYRASSLLAIYPTERSSHLSDSSMSHIDDAKYCEPSLFNTPLLEAVKERRLIPQKCCFGKWKLSDKRRYWKKRLILSPVDSLVAMINTVWTPWSGFVTLNEQWEFQLKNSLLLPREKRSQKGYIMIWSNEKPGSHRSFHTIPFFPLGDREWIPRKTDWISIQYSAMNHWWERLKL